MWKGGDAGTGRWVAEELPNHVATTYMYGARAAYDRAAEGHLTATDLNQAERLRHAWNTMRNCAEVLRARLPISQIGAFDAEIAQREGPLMSWQPPPGPNTPPPTKLIPEGRQPPVLGCACTTDRRGTNAVLEERRTRRRTFRAPGQCRQENCECCYPEIGSAVGAAQTFCACVAMTKETAAAWFLSNAATDGLCARCWEVATTGSKMNNRPRHVEPLIARTLKNGVCENRRCICCGPLRINGWTEQQLQCGNPADGGRGLCWQCMTAEQVIEQLRHPAVEGAWWYPRRVAVEANGMGFRVVRYLPGGSYASAGSTAQAAEVVRRAEERHRLEERARLDAQRMARVAAFGEKMERDKAAKEAAAAAAQQTGADGEEEKGAAGEAAAAEEVSPTARMLAIIGDGPEMDPDSPVAAGSDLDAVMAGTPAPSVEAADAEEKQQGNVNLLDILAAEKAGKEAGK